MSRQKLQMRKIQKFKNALNALFITIGEKLAPAFKGLLNISTKFLNTMTNFIKKQISALLMPSEKAHLNQ